MRSALPSIVYAAALVTCAAALGTCGVAQAHGGYRSAERMPTATPIKHLVVIYDENVAFDHYFATYPHAANPPGEPRFVAAPGTPRVNNLLSAHLLTNNPNFTNRLNGVNAANPYRLDRTQANTADQNHAYRAEQLAYDHGRADLFPLYTGEGTPGGAGAFGTQGQVMGYFDGNTVTALWNYAQHFAMSDNAYANTYGPSTPGALEVVSGQTNGVQVVIGPKVAPEILPDGAGGYTLIGDIDPAGDVCSSKTDQVRMLGRNIGNLLNAGGISWGGFTGGFNLGITNPNGTTGCKRDVYSQVVGMKVLDYAPHHNWFQYYPSTANPRHLRPASIAAIGHSFDANGRRDPANHDYGLGDFYAAVRAGNFPAVSFLKARAFQDGHAGNSDPLDEQAWITHVINFLEHQKQWRNTAVIIAWDDSDGWYDHAYTPPTNPSYNRQRDRLDGKGVCGRGTPRVGIKGRPVNGRCGPGARLPFFVISPYAKVNYVSHVRITQASVVRFIEDNWLHGKRLGGGSFDATAGRLADLFDFRSGHRPDPKLFLNPITGEPAGE